MQHIEAYDRAGDLVEVQATSISLPYILLAWPPELQRGSVSLWFRQFIAKLFGRCKTICKLVYSDMPKLQIGLQIGELHV